MNIHVFPNLQNLCFNKFKNSYNSRVKWSNLSTLLVIKNVKFIKESRQSVVRLSFPRTDRNHHM